MNGEMIRMWCRGCGFKDTVVRRKEKGVWIYSSWDKDGIKHGGYCPRCRVILDCVGELKSSVVMGPSGTLEVWD